MESMECVDNVHGINGMCGQCPWNPWTMDNVQGTVDIVHGIFPASLRERVDKFHGHFPESELPIELPIIP